MRQIKFRVWDGEKIVYPKKDGWFHDCKCDGYAVKQTVRLDTAIEKLTVMQFTGLKDKNGKEIYEGDIVTHFKILFEVCINFNGYYLQKYRLWRGEFKPDIQYSLSLFTNPNGAIESAEVIGNIHENPDLLK